MLSELQMMNTIEYRVDCQVGTSSSLLSLGSFLLCFDSSLIVNCRNCVVLCIGFVCFWIGQKFVISLVYGFWFLVIFCRFLWLIFILLIFFWGIAASTATALRKHARLPLPNWSGGANKKVGP